ncbi:MAG: HNH endonuclease signature motif containing protein, partial [Acidimicrobiales bacterium]
WLVGRRGLMDTNESAWLDVLVDFDRDGAWAADGQLNGAAWLMWACGLSRSSAYEKLRMAHELRRRPVVHDAFAAGEISYSATRAITSLDDVSTEVDAALVELARSAPICDVEAAVRYYQALDSQESGDPYRRPERREVRIWKGHHGLGQLRVTLTNDELAAVEALLRAFLAPPDQCAAADSEGAGGPFDDEPAGSGPAESQNQSAVAYSEGAGDSGAASAETDAQSAAADSEGIDDWRVKYGQTRADAFMDAVAVAMAHIGDGHASGADRYLVHLVAEVADSSGLPGGPAELVDGSPLDKEVAARIACDASFITHLVRDGGEPLYLGRKVRDWTTAQRRAITVRDRGRCRFPGCQRGITDIHHVQAWEDGGSTDVSNGALMCGRHHTLVHAGYRASGDANGELTFHRPNGSVLGVSTAPVSRPVLFRTAA